MGVLITKYLLVGVCIRVLMFGDSDMEVDLDYCFQYGAKFKRDPYYDLNHDIGTRITAI